MRSEYDDIDRYSENRTTLRDSICYKVTLYSGTTFETLCGHGGTVARAVSFLAFFDARINDRSSIKLVSKIGQRYGIASVYI